MVNNKSSNKILITGAGGMLGQSVYRHFSKNNQVWATDIDLNEWWLEYLDVKNFASYENWVRKTKPDYIFHLAAETDLEKCETNQSEALGNNFLGVKNGALIAKKYGIKFIYTSTAGVFGGGQASFTEQDRPCPLNFYAKTKYWGELAVQSTLRDYLIIRPGWMMGGGQAKDKKFISKIIKKISLGETELKIVDDRQGTPTYTEDLAKNLDLLLNKNQRGLWHMVNQGSCSRFEVAQAMVEELGYAEQIKVTKVKSDYYQKEYFAARPDSEALVNRRLIDNNLLLMNHWRVAVKSYLKNDFTSYYAKSAPTLYRLVNKMSLNKKTSFKKNVFTT
ncbi:MAG: SDR family oxidoreductase [Candidatus Komeilibacteria bacterium]|nr:SDR family oxidoreductase [Candidatus Komeilibacteria bacterium]